MTLILVYLVHLICGLITFFVGWKMREVPGPRWMPSTVQVIGIVGAGLGALQLIGGVL